MQLTTIEYDAIMIAIDHARDAIACNTFIPDYVENENGYTNESLAAALERVERYIMISNTPN